MATQTARRSRIIDHTPFFYGWIILAAGTVNTIMIGPSQSFTVGLFIDDFVADLGIGRANLALIYGVATLGASFMLPVMGRLTDRFGARKMVVVAGIGLGLSCALLGRTTGIATMLGSMLLLRFFGFGSLQLTSNHVIAQWFVARRGTVMGIAGQSLAIGLIVFPALGDVLIRRFGWRDAWFALGVLVVLVVLPVGWGLFRDTPELYGKRPDGDRSPAGRRGQELEPAASARSWTLAEARRTAVFWIFTAGLATMSMMMAGIVFHQISIFAEQGFARPAAIRAFQVVAVFSIAGNLLMGRLLDLWSPRKLLAGVQLLLAGGLILTVTMSAGWHVWIFGAVFGMISGSFRVIDATVWADYFGRGHLGSIRGATMIGTLGGTALGAYPLGLSYDYFGSYTPVMVGLTALPLGIAIVALLAHRPTLDDDSDESQTRDGPVDHSITGR